MDTKEDVMTLTPQDGQQLADQIESWLKTSRQGHPSPELEEFMKDLRQGRNVGTWAGVNYERILPFMQTRSRVTRSLAIIRNALVFFPILLTWWALRDAVELFASRGTTGDNFLVFWQNLDGFTKLSTVAVWDSAIIATVIILTVVVGMLEEDGSFARTLSREYEGLMVSLERKLSGYRYLSIEDINVAAEGTLGSLLTSSQEIQAATTSLNMAAAGTEKAVTDVSDIVEKMLGPVVAQTQMLADTLSNAAGTHTQLSGLVKSLQQDLASQVVGLQTQMAAAAADLQQNVSAALTAIRASLADSARNISDTAEITSTNLNTVVADQLRTFAERLDQVGADLRASSEDIAETSSTVHSSAIALRADLVALHETIEGLIKR